MLGKVDYTAMFEDEPAPVHHAGSPLRQGGHILRMLPSAGESVVPEVPSQWARGAVKSHHIIQDKNLLDNIGELELPPESYYDALLADMKTRHPNTQPFVIVQAVSVESFLDCSIMTGLSFGAAKMKLLQTVIKFVGE